MTVPSPALPFPWKQIQNLRHSRVFNQIRHQNDHRVFSSSCHRPARETEKKLALVRPTSSILNSFHTRILSWRDVKYLFLAALAALCIPDLGQGVSGSLPLLNFDIKSDF